MTATLDTQALKKLVKQLHGRASAEQEFEQELHHGITAVNAFFLEREQQLLSALPQHDGSKAAASGGDSGGAKPPQATTPPTASVAATAAYFREVAELHACVILNYLAVPERPDSLPTIAVTLGPGDLLYLPFGWWHEVHSHPDKERGNLSVSISHFYTPFYCRLGGKTCTTLGPLMRNPRYGDGGADDEEAAKAVIAGEKATTAIATSRRSRWLALAAIAVTAAVAAAVLVRRRRA